MEGKKRNIKFYWKNGEEDTEHLLSPPNRRRHETRPTTAVISIHQWASYQYGLVVAAAFLLGWFLGPHYQPAVVASSSTSLRSGGSSGIHSFVRQYDELPTRDTAHTDKIDGRPITKRQFLDPFVVPTVAGISVATIEPGQTVAMHSHTTMHEFFYVLEGSAVFRVVVQGNEDGGNGQQQQYNVRPGSFAYFSPPDRHEIHVAADSPDGDLKVLLVGVVVE